MTKCSIIQDLLTIYVSGVCSEDTCILVEEHIETCNECKKKLAELQNRVKKTLRENDNKNINIFKKIKRRLFMKNLLVAVASIVLTIGLIYGVIGYHSPLPYNASKISAKLAEDEVIDVFYDGNYKRATAKQIDDTIYIGYDGTLFTRLFYNGEKKQFGIGTHIMVDYGGTGKVTELVQKDGAEHPINKIYYLDSRKIKTDDNNFEKVKKDAILIWQR